MSSRSRLLITALLSIVAALGTAATASASTTIGSSLAVEPLDGAVCSPKSCTSAPLAIPGSTLEVTAPSVVVGWRLRTGQGSVAQQLRLRVLRKAGDTWTGVRTNGSIPITAAAEMLEGETRFAIDTGERLGVDQEGYKLARILIKRPGATTTIFSPALADGVSNSTTGPRDALELALQADVEPDGDRDVYGDETQDNCVGVANPDQVDSDSDGLGDACDGDVDGDGTPNGEDPDIDGDGTANGADNCPRVGNPGQGDADGDGAGDLCDDDSDGDGRPNASDNCPGAANPGQEDLDGDGIGDACDPDVDGDGSGNQSDGDDDNDGVGDAGDNCTEAPNPDQADTDGDGKGNACDPDDDNDGAADGSDTCATTASPDQTDTDKDGKGNPCDADDDADGRADEQDNCPLAVNPGQIDSDRDGSGDECDPTPTGATGSGTGPAAVPAPVGGAVPVARVAVVGTLRLRSTKVRIGTRRRLSVALECRTGACLGTLRSRHTNGAKLALVAGARKTLRLRLSARAAKRLTRSRRLRVAFRFRTYTGVSRTLTLTVLARRR